MHIFLTVHVIYNNFPSKQLSQLTQKADDPEIASVRWWLIPKRKNETVLLLETRRSNKRVFAMIINNNFWSYDSGGTWCFWCAPLSESKRKINQHNVYSRTGTFMAALLQEWKWCRLLCRVVGRVAGLPSIGSAAIRFMVEPARLHLKGQCHEKSC